MSGVRGDLEREVDQLLRQTRRFVRADDGPTATEYAVLLALIAMIVLAAFATFGDRMNDIYASINSATDVWLGG